MKATFITLVGMVCLAAMSTTPTETRAGETDPRSAAAQQILIKAEAELLLAQYKSLTMEMFEMDKDLKMAQLKVSQVDSKQAEAYQRDAKMLMEKRDLWSHWRAEVREAFLDKARQAQ